MNKMSSYPIHISSALCDDPAFQLNEVILDQASQRFAAMTAQTPQNLEIKEYEADADFRVFEVVFAEVPAEA